MNPRYPKRFLQAALLSGALEGCASLSLPPIPTLHPFPEDVALKAAVDSEVAAPVAPVAAGASARSAQTMRSGADRAAEVLELPRAPAESATSPGAPPPRAGVSARAAEVLEPHFDLNVNNAPVKEMLMSIVHGTRYSMIVHPELSGNVSLELKETTVPEVLQILRELYGYEYRITGSRVMVESGRLQTRVYNIDYLSLTRIGKSEIRVTSGSLTTPGGGSNAAAAAAGTGTTPTPQGTISSQESSHVSTTQQNDLWGDLVTTLKMIVGTSETRQVVVSPATGTVAIRAMPRELAAVSQYLRALGLNIGRQVMLEAKIVDVELSDSQQQGINWAAFHVGGGPLSIGQLSPGTVLASHGTLATGATGIDGSGNPISPNLAANVGTSFSAGTQAAGGLLGLAFQTSNFAALLSFLETQGKVHVLSSPRIATINNQKAVLKVGTDDFFVTNVSTTTVASASGSTSSPTVTVQPFFSGIALDVTAHIDENDNVTLHVHPQVSAVSEKDKQVSLGTAGTLTLPLASSSVSETDSIVRIANLNIAAIGGLMSRRDDIQRSSVPGASSMPLIGGLFRQSATSTNKRELVILIKPTVIHEAGDWDAVTSGETMRLKTSQSLEQQGEQE